jgi:hypothetical protein
MFLIIKIILPIILSYPISHYLMHKGLTLDLTMPGNDKRYKRLSIIFKIPILNVLVMFCYLVYVLHKFERV